MKLTFTDTLVNHNLLTVIGGGAASEPLVTLTKAGELIYGKDYTPDAAAKALWEAIAAGRPRADVSRQSVLEEVATFVESWRSPPNPGGRRSKLAVDIRNLNPTSNSDGSKG